MKTKKYRSAFFSSTQSSFGGYIMVPYPYIKFINITMDFNLQYTVQYMLLYIKPFAYLQTSLS